MGKLTPEQEQLRRKRISDAIRAKQLEPDYRKKQRLANEKRIATQNTPEFKQRQSEIMQTVFSNPEYYERFCEIQKAGGEAAQKRSITSKAHWDENRDKQIAAIQQGIASSPLCTTEAKSDRSKKFFADPQKREDWYQTIINPERLAKISSYHIQQLSDPQKRAQHIRRTLDGLKQTRKTILTLDDVTIHFDSRWERNVFLKLQELNVLFQYSPEPLDLGGFTWSPDFTLYLPENNFEPIYLEVKGCYHARLRWFDVILPALQQTSYQVLVLLPEGYRFLKYVTSLQDLLTFCSYITNNNARTRTINARSLPFHLFFLPRGSLSWTNKLGTPVDAS